MVGFTLMGETRMAPDMVSPLCGLDYEPRNCRSVQRVAGCDRERCTGYAPRDSREADRAAIGVAGQEDARDRGDSGCGNYGRACDESSYAHTGIDALLDLQALADSPGDQVTAGDRKVTALRTSRIEERHVTTPSGVRYRSPRPRCRPRAHRTEVGRSRSSRSRQSERCRTTSKPWCRTSRTAQPSSR